MPGLLGLAVKKQGIAVSQNQYLVALNLPIEKINYRKTYNQLSGIKDLYKLRTFNLKITTYLHPQRRDLLPVHPEFPFLTLEDPREPHYLSFHPVSPKEDLL